MPASYDMADIFARDWLEARNGIKRKGTGKEEAEEMGKGKDTRKRINSRGIINASSFSIRSNSCAISQSA